jgi:NitT/TauT family transport system ATP-binding protein
VRLLSEHDVISVDEPVGEEALARRMPRDGSPIDEATGFLTFARDGAAFPWLSHASWFYAQMVRWGQASFDAGGLATARATYRPDLYRAALKPVGVDMPAANSKVEGMLRAATPVGSSGGRMLLGPDTFCDGRIFDPDDVSGYLARLRTFA